MVADNKEESKDTAKTNEDSTYDYLWNTATNVVTIGTAAVSGFTSYGSLVEKFVSVNASMQLTNSLTGIFGGSKVIGPLATATHYTALTLVTHPVFCMFGLSATTIIATHPVKCFKLVKNLSESVYNFLDAGFNLTKAVAEASIALGLKTAKVLDPVVDSLTDDAYKGGIEVADLLKSYFLNIEEDIFAKAEVVDSLLGDFVYQPA